MARDLAAAGRTAVSGDPQLVVEGAAGRLVAAPPVYDPGGPVLLVEVVRCAEALESIEASAAARGATVSVVKQRPEDSLLAFWLSDAGYVETTAFCEPR